MANYEYRVVPFAAKTKAGQNRAAAAAQQLADLIAQHRADGFEYYRMDHYRLIEEPGCLAAFLGGGPVVIPYDVAIFRRLVG